MSSRRAKISIDLSAIQHNFQQVRKYSHNSKIMPVIKANAYGHGLLQVAKSLSEADGFCVAQLGEAIALRDAGVKKPITVFQGFLNKQQLSEMLQYQLRPAVSQRWQLDLLQAYAGGVSLDIWLKIDTGMGRLGIQPSQVEPCWQKMQNIKCIEHMGLMMHFANAEVYSHALNQQQINIFQQLVDQLGVEETSVSNSAAILDGLYEQQSWVRPGIMLYGASPVLNKTADELQLQPAMSLEAELIAINQLTKGHSVGYGNNWVCPENMPVGIVNIGYGDGYPRHADSATPLAVNGQKTHLTGRVSMDSIAVDLRGVQASCGDRVELWGQQIGIDEVAAHADTIGYELLCSAGRLVGAG